MVQQAVQHAVVQVLANLSDMVGSAALLFAVTTVPTPAPTRNQQCSARTAMPCTCSFMAPTRGLPPLLAPHPLSPLFWDLWQLHYLLLAAPGVPCHWFTILFLFPPSRYLDSVVCRQFPMWPCLHTPLAHAQPAPPTQHLWSPTLFSLSSQMLNYKCSQLPGNKSTFSELKINPPLEWA